MQNAQRCSQGFVMIATWVATLVQSVQPQRSSSTSTVGHSSSEEVIGYLLHQLGVLFICKAVGPLARLIADVLYRHALAMATALILLVRHVPT
jgi:hypothetical protein